MSGHGERVLRPRWYRRYGVWIAVLWTILAIYRLTVLDRSEAWGDALTWASAALALAWWFVAFRVGVSCDDDGVRALDRLTQQPTVPWEDIRDFRRGSWPNGIQADLRGGGEVRLADRSDADRMLAALEAERRRRLGIPEDPEAPSR